MRYLDVVPFLWLASPVMGGPIVVSPWTKNLTSAHVPSTLSANEVILPPMLSNNSLEVTGPLLVLDHEEGYGRHVPDLRVLCPVYIPHRHCRFFKHHSDRFTAENGTVMIKEWWERARPKATCLYMPWMCKSLDPPPLPESFTHIDAMWAKKHPRPKATTTTTAAPQITANTSQIVAIPVVDISEVKGKMLLAPDESQISDPTSQTAASVVEDLSEVEEEDLLAPDDDLSSEVLKRRALIPFPLFIHVASTTMSFKEPPSTTKEAAMVIEPVAAAQDTGFFVRKPFYGGHGPVAHAFPSQTPTSML